MMRINQPGQTKMKQK